MVQLLHQTATGFVLLLQTLLVRPTRKGREYSELRRFQTQEHQHQRVKAREQQHRMVMGSQQMPQTETD